MSFDFPPESKADGVGLKYWEPPEHLRYFFGSVYQFTVTLPAFHDLTRADMPQLRFLLSGEGYYEFHDGRWISSPKVCILGPTMGATRFDLTGIARVIGVSILPLGWMALGCEDADQWADNLYDAVPKHGVVLQECFDLLNAKPFSEELIDHIWTMLERMLRPVPQSMSELVSKIDQWLSESDAPQIEDIAQTTGLSARQLARYTNRLYGAPPKLLARKYRALRCASQIVLDKKCWPELCEEGRFYDQSHFIREIKHFLGLTPHQLLTEPTAVAQLTVQRRALTGVVKLNRIS